MDNKPTLYHLDIHQRLWLYAHLSVHSVPCTLRHGGAWGWAAGKEFGYGPNVEKCLFAFSGVDGQTFEFPLALDQYPWRPLPPEFALPRTLDMETECENLFLEIVAPQCPQLVNVPRIDLYVQQISAHERAEELLLWRDFMVAHVPNWTLPEEYR